jgi:hypothetical protein
MDSKSPVSPDLRPPIGSSRAANKVPFTDEQLADIIKACDHLDDQKWGNRRFTLFSALKMAQSLGTTGAPAPPLRSH